MANWARVTAPRCSRVTLRRLPFGDRPRHVYANRAPTSRTSRRRATNRQTPVWPVYRRPPFDDRAIHKVAKAVNRSTTRCRSARRTTRVRRDNPLIPTFLAYVSETLRTLRTLRTACLLEIVLLIFLNLRNLRFKIFPSNRKYFLPFQNRSASMSPLSSQRRSIPSVLVDTGECIVGDSLVNTQIETLW